MLLATEPKLDPDKDDTNEEPAETIEDGDDEPNSVSVGSYPFIHPEDQSGPIHTFNTGDSRVDYVDKFKKPFNLPAKEGEYVVTRSIIIYVFQETDQFWFPYTIPNYKAQSGADVPFEDLNFIIRRPV